MNAHGPVGEEVNLDLTREQRIGLPEAILCEPKSVAQLEVILQRARDAQKPLLLTRLTDAQAAALAPRWSLDDDRVSRVAYFGFSPQPARTGRVAIVAAGTSDAPVAREAARTLRFHHEEPLEIFDVGVAGLHRFLARVEEIRARPVVIAVAGMDAALISVTGGAVGGLVIGVPTSVGYGVAAGGHGALQSGLSSCASGVVVVNIDNGYGAACAALRALRAFAPPPATTSSSAS
jgi:NCAIR mutase (PurE)-related protein